jgi:alkylhydroperoxidase family enzyme
MLGRSVGITNEELASMGEADKCTSFDEVDKLVLAYSETLTASNTVSDELYERLNDVFSSEEIMELAMTVGLSAMVNRVHATFKTDVDDSTLQYTDSQSCPL